MHHHHQYSANDQMHITMKLLEEYQLLQQNGF